MNNDKLDNIFRDLDFNVREPSATHESDFLKKLKDREDDEDDARGKVISFWKPILAIAACLAIGILVFGKSILQQTAPNNDLASVSKEMATTQSFYSTLIASELDRLQEQQTPETKKLVKDTMMQLEMLENDYQKLKNDLIESGQDKRVIYAMVNNFQQRITLLQTVLETIEHINNLKLQDNENNLL